MFQYQTFDSGSVSFTGQPVIPLERVQFADRDADELYQSNDEGAEPEVIVLDGPGDDAADDGPQDDGMDHLPHLVLMVSWC